MRKELVSSSPLTGRLGTGVARREVWDLRGVAHLALSHGRQEEVVLPEPRSLQTPLKSTQRAERLRDNPPPHAQSPEGQGRPLGVTVSWQDAPCPQGQLLALQRKEQTGPSGGPVKSGLGKTEGPHPAAPRPARGFPGRGHPAGGLGSRSAVAAERWRQGPQTCALATGPNTLPIPPLPVSLPPVKIRHAPPVSAPHPRQGRPVLWCRGPVSQRRRAALRRGPSAAGQSRG